MTADPVVREQAPLADRNRVPDPASAPVPRWTYRDWRVPPSRGDTSPDAAQAARRRRAIHRIRHPEAWREYLATLPHYDPDYVYDEGHEYEVEWTTDPDYCADDAYLHWCVFDEEGFLDPPPSEHRALIEAGQNILGDVLEPGRILDEPDYLYPEALGRQAGLRTEGGAVQTKVQPDLAVLPEGWDDGQLPKSRTLHTDDNHPVPDLIVEIASPSTAAWDWGGKRELYKALGVREYLILDAGRPDGGDLPARPARLTLYRLRDGDYVQADGGQDPASSPSSADGVAEVLEPVYSEVCGTSLRLLRPEPEARVCFQWHEPATGRWRDRATDQAAALLASRVEGHAEGRVEGHTEGRVETLLQMLEQVLPESTYPGAVARAAQHWSADGLPADVEVRVLAAAAEPDRWWDHLGLPPDTDPTSPPE